MQAKENSGQFNKTMSDEEEVAQMTIMTPEGEGNENNNNNAKDLKHSDTSPTFKQDSDSEDDVVKKTDGGGHGDDEEVLSFGR